MIVRLEFSDMIYRNNHLNHHNKKNNIQKVRKNHNIITADSLANRNAMKELPQLTASKKVKIKTFIVKKKWERTLLANNCM